MPIYDYKCNDHGVFHELITISEYANTKPCPTCQQDSARVILVAPELLDMSVQKRNACACNERSQHEPKQITSLLKLEGIQGQTISSKTLLSADGKKSFPNQRPWMISH